MYCVMRASVPSLYNVYRRYDKLIILHSLFSYSTVGEYSSLGVLYILSVTNHDCTKANKIFFASLITNINFALSKV